MPQTRPHPHFDDKGTLSWHVELSAALSQAKAEGKLVLIDFGREACSQCRAFVQGVVPHPQIAPTLQAGFVALASDCDDPEDSVLALAEQLEDAQMLPFVMITDADGNLLDGSSGAVNPVSFKRRIEGLRAQ